MTEARRSLRAVVFDVDGTLADSEQDGHRVAFNDAFESFDMPDRWDRDTYRELLAVTGGRARLEAWFEDPRSSAHGIDSDEAARLAAELHAWKTNRFVELVTAARVPARPGAAALIDDLAAASVTVAVATTGSRAWVAPLLDGLFGRDRFAVVVTADEVEERKPDPEAYLLALHRLGVTADEALAVEDSGAGMEAARAAGLACVVVTNDETERDAVEDADLVVAGFGSHDHPMTVLVDRHGAATGDRLDAGTMLAVQQGALRARGRSSGGGGGPDPG